jgi:hypothetical protein
MNCITTGHRHGLAPLFHYCVKLLTLVWSERVPHGQVVINRGFLHCELCGADFLQLPVDRRAVRLFGRDKVAQIHTLDFKIGSVADLCLPELGFLLPDLRRLLGGNADLLTDVWIIQKPPEFEFPPSHTSAGHTHPVPLALRTVSPHLPHHRAGWPVTTGPLRWVRILLGSPCEA